MADQNTGLPVRTEADGTDERLHVKVVDGLVPAQRMTVDTDLNAHVEVHGNDPTGTDRVVRTSQLGAITPDGVYDVANNTKPGNVGLIASARNAGPGDTTQTQRLTSVTNSTKRLLDVSIHDEAGAAFSATNPLPVFFSDSEGVEVNDYKAAAAIASGATDNHDFTAAGPGDFVLTQISSSASGKMKIDVKVETAAASGVYNTKFTGFNSTAHTEWAKELKEPIRVPVGAKVRLTMTNKDNQSQDLYSTISGHQE